MTKQQNSNEIVNAIYLHKNAFFVVALFSFAINLLYLTPSIFMMQVYDRVIISRSEYTLLMLIILAISLVLIMVTLEYFRSQVLIRVGNALDKVLSIRTFTATFESNLRSNSSKITPLNDLNNVRQFVTGNGLFAFLDAPWMPIYLLVIFHMHFVLGVWTLLGALLLLLLSYINEKVSRVALNAANDSGAAANYYASTNLKNTEVIEAMGMLQPLTRRWYSYQEKMLEQQTIASSRAAVISSVTKFFRLIIQSGVIALGAYLVMENQVTAGVLMGASILVGRALSPIELVIASWKGYVGASASYERLKDLLQALPPRKVGMSLPAPKGHVALENAYCVPPGGKVPTLKNITFSINPGEIVGVIGPSASGKSTLSRLIVGVWPAQNGKVRLDGADVYHWNKDELGAYIGYLPQDIELFNGTVAENIARFGDLDSEKIVSAAEKAGVHQMILQLPNGYDTQLTESGGGLSGGQRQRLGIARALYGDPSLIVLDEPNSNLDDAGEAALAKTVKLMKELGKAIVVVSHRVSLLQIVDKLLLLKDGQIVTFGPREEVLQTLRSSNPAAQSRPAINE